jgi:hypothetical protein
MPAPTQEDVRDLWATAIAQNNTILALTDKIYNRDLSTVALSQDSALRFEQNVNFFNYIVRRWVEAQMGGTYVYHFLVDVFYTHQDKAGIDAYNKVLDGLETVETLVRTEMGSRWDSLMDDYQLQQAPIDISQIDINNVICWRGHQIYTAFKKI